MSTLNQDSSSKRPILVAKKNDNKKFCILDVCVIMMFECNVTHECKDACASTAAGHLRVIAESIEHVLAPGNKKRGHAFTFTEARKRARITALCRQD